MPTNSNITMKLSVVKEQLDNLNAIIFELPNGHFVPAHFHVTEVGMVTKNFIDCGGTVRAEKTISFQLWEDQDVDHRLAPQKLKNIIELSEQKLGLEDLEVEVEYQGETIGRYGLDFNGSHFLLTNTMTDCLAKDKCGIPEPEPAQSSCCSPESGCC